MKVDVRHVIVLIGTVFCGAAYFLDLSLEWNFAILALVVSGWLWVILTSCHGKDTRS